MDKTDQPARIVCAVCGEDLREFAEPCPKCLQYRDVNHGGFRELVIEYLTLAVGIRTLSVRP